MLQQIARTLRDTLGNEPVRKPQASRRVRLHLEALEQRDVPAGLVAAYNFDAGAGAILADVSGNNNTGSILGANWTNTSKYGGKALNFDGTNDRVNIADSTSLRLTSGMTLEAWVRPTAVTNIWRDVLSKGSNDFNLSATTSNASRASQSIVTGGKAVRTFAPSALPLNTWSHVAATYNGSTLRLYVNGVQVSSVAKTGNIKISAGQLQIGGNSFLGRYFRGQIDDVRVYDIALNQTQIQNDMNTPVAPSDTTAPTVSITAPGNGSTVAGSVAVNANAADNVGVVGVQFFLDGVALGGEDTAAPYSVTWNTATATNGTHSLTARARDAAGNLGTSSTIQINVNNGDTTAPTATIIAPANGATVSSTVNVTANAADNVGVVGVQFFLDGNPLGAEDTTSPYSFSWNTATASNGSHTLTARARDAAGNLGTSSPIQVTVNNSDTTAPTVSVTAPANGATVSSTVNVTATASDNVGVSGVQFFLDGNPLGAEDTTSPYAVSWNTATTSNGSHTLTARARDAAGNTTTSTSVQVTVNNADTTAPSVSITAPSNGSTVSSTINVTANASDNVGVSGVQFFLDGSPLGAEDTTSPYAVSWNTTTANNGSHTLTARARDAAGNMTTSTAVQVNVNNSGSTITVSNVTQLVNAVNNLQSGQTIVMNPGTYQLTDTLWFPQNRTNVTLRGSTGNRNDVIVQGNGMNGTIGFGIWVRNIQNITFSDFTVRNFKEHGIILNEFVESPTLRNMRVADVGDQLIKVNPDGAGGGVDNGILENSLIEYTTQAPDAYTNGLDVHTGLNWIVRNNVFRNIKSASGLAGPALLMWNRSANTLTEGNTFINNQRDIAYGLDPAKSNDHAGGIIRNNFISRTSVPGGDVAIGVFNSANTQVLNNTVRLAGTYPNAMEYRFAGTTGVVIRNNLTDGIIQARDGATGTVNTNVTNAQSSWFVNAAGHDLHLLGTATAAINTGATLANVPSDFDGQARPAGASYDIGADEYVNSSDGTAPTVSITAPSNGSTVSGSVSVTATASDNVGVVGVQFFLDGNALGAEDTTSPYSVSWNTATATNGTHTLTARARDAAGNLGNSTSVQVTVSNSSDTTNPTVSITAPTNGSTVTGTTTITATAADNVGVVGVQFFVDGNPIGAEDPSSPYGISWNTTTVANGTHTLTARARDAAGNLGTSASVTITVNNSGGGGGPTNQPLVYRSNVNYVGAFRVPNHYNSTDGMSYGGQTLAFNPANNSLFISGKDMAIANISIPQNIVNSSNLNSLSTATILQPWRDVINDLPHDPLSGITNGTKLGGLMVANGKLYGTSYAYYDGGSEATVSHWYLDSLNLSNAQAHGYFKVGNMNPGFVAGYMTPVPTEWQSALGAPYITGWGDIAVASRTSNGPSAFGFDPNAMGYNTTAPTTPYFYYPVDQPLGPYSNVGANPLHSGTSSLGGAVFVPGSSSFLVFGSTGANFNGYGMAPDFGDTVNTYNGPHTLNGEYVFQVWAYNANDFIAVKQGTKQPHQVMPYNVWNFNLPIRGGIKLGGVAFDQSTGRLYVSLPNADHQEAYSSVPLIQVFQLSLTSGTGGSPTAPEIGTLAVTPSNKNPGPISAGVVCTLTAGNAYATSTTANVTGVKFYLDTNKNGSLEVGTDQLIGNGTPSTIVNAQHNWVINMQTSGMAVGSWNVFAQAIDSNGLLSSPIIKTFAIK